MTAFLYLNDVEENYDINEGEEYKLEKKKERFGNKNGHCLVPDKDLLGNWVGNKKRWKSPEGRAKKAIEQNRLEICYVWESTIDQHKSQWVVYYHSILSLFLFVDLNYF